MVSPSYFLISPYEMKSIQIQNSCIDASFAEELLGIKTDSNLTFRERNISLCFIRSVHGYKQDVY